MWTTLDSENLISVFQITHFRSISMFSHKVGGKFYKINDDEWKKKQEKNS